MKYFLGNQTEISKGKKKLFNLVATAGVLELARVETGAAAEEVVNLTRLHVVGESGDEERVDSTPVLVAAAVVVLLRWWLRWLLEEVVGIVRLRMSHFL